MAASSSSSTTSTSSTTTTTRSQQQPHHPTTTTPLLEAGNWQLLPTPPPHEEGDKIEVGVAEIHPSLNRIAYATRARNDQAQDLGKTKIVIHDYFFDNTTINGNSNSNSNNPNNNGGAIIASFTLRELTKRINEFRTKSHSAAMAASLSSHPHEILHGLTSSASKAAAVSTPAYAMPYTVQMLGAVQNISFLTRDAIRCCVPVGYVRELVRGQEEVLEPLSSGMQRLLIGFRRCVVVVSVFHLKQQQQQQQMNQKEPARGVQVVAYIGPDDFDEWEHNEKARKRQPSSFPIPISENLLAYGCYDGGIRFYDIVRRKQAKSALGPNGRDNPIVKVINANSRTQCDNTTNGPQTIPPRIISVCASGIAYLWDLDLSIDLDTGELLHFDIPPPVAGFDGLSAAVSGRGVPAKHPPALSPTGIAALSPCSSWEQTDEVNAQFDVSFESDANLFYWTFSPDCVGSTLMPHATREERLNANGALACWELERLPRRGWPPPILPPRCVVQLPRTTEGKVSSDMVVSGVRGVLPDSCFATVYITSSNELMAGVTDLERHGDSVQLDIDVMSLGDMNALDYGPSGYTCFTIAVSCMHPSLIAIGTQHGILLTEISEIEDVRRQLFSIQEEAADQQDIKPQLQCCSSDSSSEVAGMTTQLQQMFVTRITELESHNEMLECQVDDLKREATKMITETRLDEIQSQVKGILQESETELFATLAKVSSLEDDLKSKNQACRDLETEVDALKGDLDFMGESLEQEKQANEETTLKLAEIEQKAQSLEEEAITRNETMKALQDDLYSLRTQLDGGKCAEERERTERESRLTRADYSMANDSSDELRLELSIAVETEESLRKYITLLEEDKSIQDKELEDARQEAEKYAKKRHTVTENLRLDIKEQKLAIDSLVDLLERQTKGHEKESADQKEEVSLLKNQLSDLQLKYQTDLQNTNKSNEEDLAKLKSENALMRAEIDDVMGSEIFLAMKIELQNALNEVARLRHERKGASP